MVDSDGDAWADGIEDVDLLSSFPFSTLVTESASFVNPTSFSTVQVDDQPNFDELFDTVKTASAANGVDSCPTLSPDIVEYPWADINIYQGGFSTPDIDSWSVTNHELQMIRLTGIYRPSPWTTMTSEPESAGASSRSQRGSRGIQPTFVPILPKPGQNLTRPEEQSTFSYKRQFNKCPARFPDAKNRKIHEDKAHGYLRKAGRPRNRDRPLPRSAS